MKKFSLIIFSLLVLVVGVGLASAADANCTVDDVSIEVSDHQCGVDEISSSAPDVVQDDVDGISSSAPDVVQDDVGADVNGSAEIVADDNSNCTEDTGVDSVVTIENSTKGILDENGKTANIINDNPREIKFDAEKLNSLKKDIAKYDKFFKKNNHKIMSSGKEFSELDLILEIYKNYSYEDTIIIAMNVLHDNGVRVTLYGLECMMQRMIDGSIYTQDYQMNASYYKDAMAKIQQSHKSLNSEVKKYSDLFNKKNGKQLVRADGKFNYGYLEFMMEVYRYTPDIEKTIWISTYAMQNCGYNISIVSLEDTFHQIIDKSLIIDGSIWNGFYYTFLYNALKHGHDSHNDNYYKKCEIAFKVL